MNILNLLNYSPDFGGGIAKHLLSLGEKTKSEGHRLFLGFPESREWQKELLVNSRLIIIPEIKNAISPAYPRVIDKICKNHSIDILHIHFTFALAFSLACSFKKWEVPTVYHWHNPPVALNEFLTSNKTTKGRLKRLSSRAIARFTDYRVIDQHISMSKEISELLIKNRWTTQKNIFFLQNGIESSLAIKDIHQKSKNISIIGTVANFRPQKDHVTLLKAFDLLLKTGLKSELWIVGDGPTRPAIEKLTSELGLESSVRFLGTLLNPAEIFGKFDVFVLSTNYEGHPLVILEAMSFGLPIVATRISSIPETIIDGNNGLLFNPNDPSDLANALQNILSDEALYHRLSEAAINSFKKQLTVDDWSNNVVSLYKNVLVSKSK